MDMRLPKQTPGADRDIQSIAAACATAGNGSFQPAGWLDILKTVGMGALKGAIGSVAG